MSHQVRRSVIRSAAYAGGVVAIAVLMLGLVGFLRPLAPAPPTRQVVPQLPPATEDDAVVIGETLVGEMGVTETVDEIMARQSREPEWDGVVRPAEEESEEQEAAEEAVREMMESRPQNPDAPDVPCWPPPADERGAIENADGTIPGHHDGGPYLPQPIGTNTLGIQISEAGFVPPDSHGACGPTQVVVIANGRIKTLAKATGLADGALNATTNTFFTSVRNGIGTSDPMVKFDRLTNRWFVSMINVSTPNRIMLAVSSGPTITGTASFTFYFIAATGLLDYPGMGVDANAVYIGGNVFNPGFSGADGYVIRKSSVTSGGPIVYTRFANICTSAGNGVFAPRGIDNDDAAATEGYFIGVSGNSYSLLVMRRVSTPGGTPTISGNINLTVPTTVAPQVVPALGSTGSLDGLDDRLFEAVIRKNRLTGISSLWSAHNIEVNSSGVASTSGNRNGSRWYEIRNFTATPSLTQSGTLFDSAASSPVNYWIPGVCMSGQGHMALGCSAAGTARHAEAVAAGRLSGDTLGTIQAPTTIVTSSTNYNVQSGTQRWGDYSQVCIDPNDDMTMWTFQEYCNANNSWGVRVTQLVAPPPATPSSCAPAAVTQGDVSVNVVVTGTSASGSGFFDPDASFPNHIAAAVNGGGVTVNSVTFSDATHITLNVTVAAGAATGARTISVTNPDGQSAASAAGILTVNAGGCVGASVSGQPSNQTVCSGGSASFAVSGAGTAPLSYQWRRGTTNLSNGGNISGATTATLTINPAGPGDAASNYNCVITNACGNGTSNNASLTVNTAAGISGQPSNQTVCSGGSASFAVSATGTPAPTYQWRRGTTNLSNGGNISGATTATLTINPAGTGDAASNYNCVVTNACGSATSNSASLTVNTAAGISGQPSNQTVCSGGSASFTISATGTPAPTYQWRRGTTNLSNGGNISGATTATLTINPAGTSDAASNYNCVVTNACGNATSNNASLTVNTAAGISGQPSNQTVCSGGSASFTVSATGTPTPTYQWRRGTTNLSDGGNISGTTTATLTINPAGTGDAASNYNCIVTNACGSATSSNASLTVNTAPSITGQPADQTVATGGSATFTVVATGTAPLSYQWRRAATNLVDGGSISGAGTASLTINPAAAGDAAPDYNCVVTNACGVVVSNNAQLTVNSPPCPGDLNHDGVVDLVDLTTFLANFGAASGATADQGDMDGDGDIDLVDLTLFLSTFGTVCP